jgi:hypothetical protein
LVGRSSASVLVMWGMLKPLAEGAMARAVPDGVNFCRFVGRVSTSVSRMEEKRVWVGAGGGGMRWVSVMLLSKDKGSRRSTEGVCLGVEVSSSRRFSSVENGTFDNLFCVL